MGLGDLRPRRRSDVVGVAAVLHLDRSRAPTPASGVSRPADRRTVAAVTPTIAAGLDRTRDIAETARLVFGASAGVVLTCIGEVLPLPGLTDDRRLRRGAPVLRVAADELARSRAYVSFLAATPAPCGERLVRVSTLDVGRPDLDHLCAAVLLSPPGDLCCLTVTDLRVLGLLVEGVTDVPAIARAVGTTGEAVTGSLERCLHVLGTGDLTAATVRALRLGARIPPGLAGSV